MMMLMVSMRHSEPRHATTSERNGLRFSPSKIRLLNELLIGKMREKKNIKRQRHSYHINNITPPKSNTRTNPSAVRYRQKMAADNGIQIFASHVDYHWNGLERWRRRRQ